jgi:hypothetical protein
MQRELQLFEIKKEILTFGKNFSGTKFILSMVKKIKDNDLTKLSIF